jgi:hypothetical protein
MQSEITLLKDDLKKEKDCNKLKRKDDEDQRVQLRADNRVMEDKIKYQQDLID